MASPDQASLNAGAPRPIRVLLDGLDRLSRLDGWLGALCLVSLTVLMLSEVIVRALSNFLPWVPASIPFAWEWSSYLMAATFTFGSAMTLRAGGHIRVALLMSRAGPGVRRLLEVMAAAIALAFVAFLALAMAKFAYASYDRGQVSIATGTSLWVPQAVVAFGMVLLALQLLARLLQAALGLPVEDHRMKAGALVE